MHAPLDQQTTLATATEFICKYISFESGHKFIHKHKLHPDSFPKPTKASGDSHCAKEMLPIEIKFVCDGGRKAAIEGNLAQIVTFISEKYSKREFAVDGYLVPQAEVAWQHEELRVRRPRRVLQERDQSLPSCAK